MCYGKVRMFGINDLIIKVCIGDGFFCIRMVFM